MQYILYPDSLKWCNLPKGKQAGTRSSLLLLKC